MHDIIDRMAFLNVAAGIWFYTTELRGKPTEAEARETLKHFPPRVRDGIVASLVKFGQVGSSQVPLRTRKGSR